MNAGYQTSGSQTIGPFDGVISRRNGELFGWQFSREIGV
jgi:hypothetical protein